MDERWHGNLFQKYEATDENDLDFAIVLFSVGTHIYKEEEIVVIVSEHTVEWGQWDRIAAGTAEPWMW